jgi:hypothetical protein
MEAIYFGNIKVWGYGTGNGPWIMADMGTGCIRGPTRAATPSDPTTSYRFTTAAIEGEPDQWAILGGNAQSGGLATDFSGVRPGGYNPMHKEGAIILGIGGDNSKGSAGTFYEGVMTSGYPSASTKNAIQASTVAAGYSTSSASTGSTHAATDTGELACGNKPHVDATVTDMSTELKDVTCRACHSQLGLLESEEANSRLQALFVISITLGLRPGELRMLTWDHVDLNQE